MTPAHRIIAKFQGTRQAALALQLAVSTVQSWKDTGRIPAHHQDSVLKAGARLKDPVTERDFFVQAGDKMPPKASAA